MGLPREFKESQMITYGYGCKLDGYFERDFKMGDQPQFIECPICKDAIRRDYNVPAISFKGDGFYVNDNRQNKGEK